MKFLLAIAVILAISGAQAEPGLVTQLRESQQELAIGHDFFQTFYSLSRNQATAYMQTLTTEILANFLESYESLIETQTTTESALRAFNQSECLDGVWRRWDLQVARHGQRLSSCLEFTVQEFAEWTDWVNNFIEESQRTTNRVQNVGLDALASMGDYTTEIDDLPRRINRGFREILLSAAKDLDEFEGYRWRILEEEEQILDELKLCDRHVVKSFTNLAASELEWAENCEPIPSN